MSAAPKMAVAVDRPLGPKTLAKLALLHQACDQCQTRTLVLRKRDSLCASCAYPTPEPGVPVAQTIAGRCARFPALLNLLDRWEQTTYREPTGELLAAQAAQRDEEMGGGQWQCLCVKETWRAYGAAACAVCGMDGTNAIMSRTTMYMLLDEGRIFNGPALEEEMTTYPSRRERSRPMKSIREIANAL